MLTFHQQHAILINQVQAPEDAVPPAQPPQSPPLNGTTVTADAPQPQLPLPTIAPPRPTAPSFVGLVIRQLLSDPQARICKLYLDCTNANNLISTLGLGMFIFFTFIIRVIVSPSLTLFFVASMYSMFWLPQIIRSVKRGRSSSLSAEYLVGTSICRLYFALCE